MKLNYLDDYIKPFHEKTGKKEWKGAALNFLTNGGTINRTPSGMHLIEFAVDANLNEGEQLTLMVQTKQPRKELEKLSGTGLISVAVEWLGTVQILGKDREILRPAIVHGVIKAEKLQGDNGKDFPPWVRMHHPTNAMIIQSYTADKELLYLQTVCLARPPSPPERLSRAEADRVLDQYYEERGLKEDGFFAYDGNHRMLH